ncbi:MAG: hypothetical protein MI923_16205 [Phycisphaerales bacterium]|nr:hypothetical protein [Phycisphaerales bacterium]
MGEQSAENIQSGIREEIGVLAKIITGNGDPQKGLVCQVARLNGTVRLAIWIVTLVLGAIGGIAIAHIQQPGHAAVIAATENLQNVVEKLGETQNKILLNKLDGHKN